MRAIFASMLTLLFLDLNDGLPPTINTESSMKTDEQRLLYHLMRGYERAVRPVRNASQPIVVKLGLTLTNIFDMDEKNQVLTTNVWLDQEWKDELLQWDPQQFSGIQSIRIPCDLIWLPDIVLYNNADDYTTGYMRSRAMVYYDGTVFWPSPTQLRSTCKIDVTYFPFDSQRCFLKFGSWTYHGFQVDVTNRSSNVDLTNYVISGEFQLVQVHQKRRVVKYTCCPEPYPDVTFFIHVRRKTLYYMYNVVFPCMMMSALTLLVFCLPPDSGEKIALGITVLLAFSVFVLAIAEKMPETSDSMPLIGIYLTVVMGMTSVSVVMTVMVLNFHHRGPFHKEIPYWIRYLILDKLRRMLCMKFPYSQMRPKDTSLHRRLSLKLTMDSLHDELMNDIGVTGQSTFIGPPAEQIGGSMCSNINQRRVSEYGEGERGSLSMGAGGDFNNKNRKKSSFSGGGGLELNRQLSYNLIESPTATSTIINNPSNVGDHCNSIPLLPRQRSNHVSPSPRHMIPSMTSPSPLLVGGMPNNQSHQSAPTGGDCRRRNQLQEEILKTLQVLISRQELDDECEEIATEWRQVAQVIDRLLFWVFLIATVVITLTLLIIIPLICHSMEEEYLDEKLFGLSST